MSLRRGIELFNGGLYWEAHEAWEEAWTPDRRGPDRGFYKGLIQIAAGCLHYQRRNRRGAINKWRGGADYLRPYLPRHHDLDLSALVEKVDGYLVALDGDEWPEGLEMPILKPPACDPADGQVSVPDRPGIAARRRPRSDRRSRAC